VTERHAAPLGARASALGLLALLPVALTVGARRFASWDVWWQLATARLASATRSTLPVDPFSWSMPDAPFVHKDLGGYLVLWGAFDLGAWGGVALLRALCALVVAAGLGACIPRAHRGSAVVALTGGLALCALQDRIVPRALIFSLALFPAVLALAEHARVRLRTHRSLAPLLLPVFVLQALWMNLHRGAMLGVVIWCGLLAASLLASALVRWLPRSAPIAGPPARPRDLLWLAALAATSVLGGLLTPSGLHAYRTGLQVSHDPIHRTRISEWAPWSWDVAQSLYGLASVLVAVSWLLLAASLLRSLRRSAPGPVDLWHAGTLFVFTWQGLHSVRWMPEAALIALVVLARIAAPGLGSLRRAGSTAATLLAASSALVWNLATSNHQLGLGNEAHRYPERALAFALDTALGPRVHNTFVYGGYTIFAGHPSFRVLIDGRNDMVYASTFYLRCIEAQQDAQLFGSLREDHAGDWVLADNTPGRQSFLFLADDPDWMAIHWSEAAVVWVPRATHPHLASRALRFLHPAFPVESLGAAVASTQGDPARLAEIESELVRIYEDDPGGVRALTLLVLFYETLGAPARSARDAWLEELLRLHPSHPGTLGVLERIDVSGSRSPGIE
jgi:hypothetical protein